MSLSDIPRSSYLSMTNDYYPLYLHDFKRAEQRLLIEILLDGMTAGVYRRTALEKKAGINLRHVIGARDQDLKKRFSDKKGRNDIPQAVWVFLYKYVMGEFRILCAAQELGALLVKIDRLIEMGMKSGRYDNDMHLFNRQYMFLDSRSASVDSRYQDDVYVGFRFNSAGRGMIISAMRVREESGRNVFSARTLNDVTQRESRGIAYQLNPLLYLFGFLNDDEGGEFYALRAEGHEHEILFGIMSTVNKDGIAHTKQCCFIKLRLLYETDNISISALSDSVQLESLRTASDLFFDGQEIVYLTAGRQPIDLKRYLTREILFPRNTGQSIEPSGTPG